MTVKTTLLAIDQGTTSTRAILFSRDGSILYSAQRELTQHYPRNGWVEQDAQDIWRDTLDVCREVLSHADAATCTAIGITNQRETTILWHRDTGEPIHNAIVWQDRRTAGFCDTIKPHEDMIRAKTGLLVDPYFSASKISWLLYHVPDARALAEQGKLAFGTVDCFLLWRLTNGRVHATDTTNAARTGLFNIVTHAWDDALLALYGIPASILPQVKDNVAHFGDTDAALFGRAIPIGGMAGDQHAAMIGQHCFKPGMMKSTYGTGCFALMHIGDTFKASEHRLLTTPAYRLDGVTQYAIEGSIFIAGAAVQWLRDSMGLIDTAAQSEELALSVTDNHGVYFIPAFTGLGAPHWRPDIRAGIYGMTRDTTRAHIVRAALEAQAYQTLDLLRAMQADTGVFPEILRVDGGLVNNGFVCQFMADILGVPVELPIVAETTALGAAILAGLYAGVYESVDDVQATRSTAKTYQPVMPRIEAERLYAGWTDTMGGLLGE